MVAHDFDYTSCWDSGMRILQVVLPKKCAAHSLSAWTKCTLIIRSQAECFPRDGERTTLVHFPGTLRARWFEKPADVCPVVLNGSESAQWWGVRWRWQDTVHNASSIALRLSLPRYRHAAPLKLTCNQVNFLRNQDDTRSDGGFLGNAFLLGVNVVEV